MDFPLQLALYSLPSLLYVLVRHWRGFPAGQIRENLGWQAGPPSGYLLSLGLGLVAAGLGGLAVLQIPAQVLSLPEIYPAAYAHLPLSAGTLAIIWLREAVFTSLGEEVFFRGFLGGWLNRRVGFVFGNALQALAFITPVFLLLGVSQYLLLLLIVRSVIGWLLGWLRYKTGSILPGWMASSLIYTAITFAVVWLVG